LMVIVVADVEPTAEVVTVVITGGAFVVKVAFGEVADRLELLVEATSKSYSVPCVKPVIVTECEVTSVLFSADCEPYAVVVP